MPDVPMPDISPEQAGSNYLFYEGAWQLSDVANLDKVFNNIGGLLSKGEAAINKELTDLSKIKSIPVNWIKAVFCRRRLTCRVGNWHRSCCPTLLRVLLRD